MEGNEPVRFDIILAHVKKYQLSNLCRVKNLKMIYNCQMNDLFLDTKERSWWL